MDWPPLAVGRRALHTVHVEGLPAPAELRRNLDIVFVEDHVVHPVAGLAARLALGGVAYAAYAERVQVFGGSFL